MAFKGMTMRESWPLPGRVLTPDAARAEYCDMASPAWLVAMRRQYPGQLERRAMEYMGQPARVASGRERLGE